MSKELILVVDDELDNRIMMRYFLESWGYQVELAANGKEALQKVAANPPQMVLLDLEMPVMNGFDACHQLKSNEATEQIPVIMFTGREQTADKVKGFQKGADDYVIKTVDPEELQIRIEMILKRAKRVEPKPSATNGNQVPQEEHVFSGSLSELYFPETMQLIMTYKKSGVLTFKDQDREGRVFLREGDVIHAEFGEKQGEDAFYDLAVWKSGQFIFRLDELIPPQTIDKSGTNLLMEATRRLDEWNMFSSKIPSFDVVPVRIPLSGADSFRVNGEDWRILRHTDGRKSIRQIAEKLELDLHETARAVYGLITIGIVSIEAKAGREDVIYNAVPEMAPELQGGNEVQFSARQWKVLSSVDGKRNVAVLALLVGAPLPELIETLKGLIEQGILRMHRSGSAPPVPRKPAANTGDETSSRGNVARFQPRAQAIGCE